jgi:hypothetical protein
MQVMDFRTIAFGISVFCATFLAGWWFNIGSLASGISAVQPTTVGQAPAAQTPTAANQKVAVRTPQSKDSPPKAWQGPGLVNERSIRDAVITWSQNYQRPACDQDVRWGYTMAATRYAEALMRDAGCNNFPRCPISNGQLARVWEANRSMLDMPVAQAMAEAHAAGGLSARDFRGDVGRAVQVIAGRDFASGSAPQCSSGSNRSSRVRIRRR